jgi:hypothetical protein
MVQLEISNEKLTESHGEVVGISTTETMNVNQDN